MSRSPAPSSPRRSSRRRSSPARRRGGIPHGKCSEMAGHAKHLSDAVGDVIGETQARNLAGKLMEAYRVEAVGHQSMGLPPAERDMKFGELDAAVHEPQMQVQPCAGGIPWLGFVVYPERRLLKRRNAVNFTRRLERNIDDYRAGRISFAELDAGVKGWGNHVRYADTGGLREHLFATHAIPPRPG